MQAFTAASKTEKRASLDSRSLLSLYTTGPLEELTLDEFELLAVDRLQLLRAIEQLKIRGYDDKELESKLRDLEKKLLLSRKDAHGRLSDEKRDKISHFILRLAYCRSEDLRKWFLAQECVLFKFRLDQLTDEQRKQFMSENRMNFVEASIEEKKRLLDKLAGLAGVAENSVASSIYFKVPFHQALALLASRQAYLEGGFVFVPLSKLVSILVTRFRSTLSRALVEAANMFDVVATDSRIAPFLQNVNKQFLGNDFSNRNGAQADKLSPEHVEAAAETNMPLCMKTLHQALKRDHKLKHWGRLQYGLFLKGAGLDLDGALAFFETHFTKSMGHDVFAKQYHYTFRHMYGKEGARKNYTPYSCLKIIMGTPPEPGAFHGCPYKHSSDTALNNMLGAMKMGSQDVSDILSIAKSGNYQLACQKHFDIVHPNHTADAAANHPNQWFLASTAYFKAKNGPLSTSTVPSTTVLSSDQMEES